MFKYFIAAIKLVPIIIFEYFVWILRYSLNPKKYPLELRFKRVQKLCRKVMKVFRMRGDYSSVEEFYKNRNKTKNHLFVCNHQCAFDPLCFICLADSPITFVAKKESKKLLFVGRVITILDGEFLDRGNLRQELKVFMHVQEKLKSNQKLDILIFPEGTRNKDPKNNPISPFHAGTFRCAYKTESPIAVFCMYGAYRSSSFKYKNKYNPIQIEYLKTINYEEYKQLNTDEVAKLTHDLMNAKNEELKINDRYLMKMLNKKHFD